MATSKEKLPKLMADRTKDLSTTFIETGQVALDLALSNGRGIPLGDFITFFAPPGSGKSTILGDMLKRVLTRYKNMGVPFKAMYIDIEGSKDLLKDLGLSEFIESEDLIYYNGQATYAGLEELYNAILGGEIESLKDVKLIIIDSITSVSTETKLGRGVEEADYGIIAKAASEFFKKFIGQCTDKLSTLMINQIRSNQGGGIYDPKYKNASGEAGKHYSSIIATLKKKVSKADPDLKPVKRATSNGIIETQEKFIVQLITSDEGLGCKNRFGRLPNMDALVEYGKGVVNAFTIRNILKGQGFITLSGSYYTFSPDVPPLEGMTNMDKKIQRTELNRVINKNRSTLINFLKERDLYKLDLGKIDGDVDGFSE
jgi:RecA/RadA recombinase